QAVSRMQALDRGERLTDCGRVLVSGSKRFTVATKPRMAFPIEILERSDKPCGIRCARLGVDVERERARRGIEIDIVQIDARRRIEFAKFDRAHDRFSGQSPGANHHPSASWPAA